MGVLANMAQRGTLSLLGLCAVVGLLMARDFVSVESAKDGPALKLNTFMGPTLRFMYCYS